MHSVYQKEKMKNRLRVAHVKIKRYLIKVTRTIRTHEKTKGVLVSQDHRFTTMSTQEEQLIELMLELKVRLFHSSNPPGPRMFDRFGGNRKQRRSKRGPYSLQRRR